MNPVKRFIRPLADCRSDRGSWSTKPTEHGNCGARERARGFRDHARRGAHPPRRVVARLRAAWLRREHEVYAALEVPFIPRLVGWEEHEPRRGDVRRPLR